MIGYGFFPGGDPRTFYPDPEASTEKEREAHRLACEAWDAFDRRKKGEIVELPDPKLCGWEVRDGQMVHIARAPYGLGTYEYDDGWDDGDDDAPADPEIEDWER